MRATTSPWGTPLPPCPVCGSPLATREDGNGLAYVVCTREGCPANGGCLCDLCKHCLQAGCEELDKALSPGWYRGRGVVIPTAPPGPPKRCPRFEAKP